MENVSCLGCARKWLNLGFFTSHDIILVCSCHPGWSGDNCTECEPRDDCVYGRCVTRPFECVCYSGFQGKSCEEPICKIGCNETGVRLSNVFLKNLFNKKRHNFRDSA